MTDGFTERLTDAESMLESLSTSTTDEDPDDGIGTDVRGITTILGEAAEILQSIDVSKLPDAIDDEQVREAIELGELPEALRDEEDAEVVKLREIVRAIDLGRTLAAMDVSEVWESKRSIESAADELRGGEEGMLGATSDGDVFETDLDDAVDMAAEELKEDVDVTGGDLSAYQEVIQQQAIEGVDAFRDGLLKTHGKFERIVETNHERMRQQDRSPSSRNPTAVSTIPTARADVSSVPNYATMPRRVRHSDAPTRTHIYGDRFRRERKKRGYD